MASLGEGLDVLVQYKHHNIEGIDKWMWPRSDTGLWEGPLLDWPKLKEGFLKHVKNFNVVVQAGGACGMYPRLLKNYFNYVYTFEPDALNFHCLSNNCDDPNIIKINAALGDHNELMAILNQNKHNLGTHRVTTDGERYIPMFTIDQLNLTACDYIQLDCETFEENVIRGAINTIQKFKPVITLETCSPGIEQMLLPLGYSFKGRFGHIDQLLAVD